MAITNAIMQMRRGNETDFDPDKMHPGEWAVSTDTKYVRMCFSPGVCVRMATYDAFEVDMEKIQKILEECQSIEEAVTRINAEVSNNLNAVAEYTSQAKQYRDEAESFKNQASAIVGVDIATEDVPGLMAGGDNAVENGILTLTKTTTDRTLYKSKAGGLKINSIVGDSQQKQYSGKNLLNWNGISKKTMNGVTFTPVKDENGLLLYIDVNGTATANAYINVYRSAIFAINGEYIGSGCPVGGGSSKYWMQFNYVSSNGSIKGAIDYGNGVNYTDYSSDSSVSREIYIFVSAGTTVSNLKFYPMSRKADITDDTYEPYVGGIPSPNPDYPQEIKIAGASGSVEVITKNEDATQSTTATITTPDGLASVGGVYDEIIKYADGSGKRIQRIGKSVIDGSKTFLTSTYNYSDNCMMAYCEGLPKVPDTILTSKTIGYCNKFQMIASIYSKNTDVEGVGVHYIKSEYSSRFEIRIRKDRLSSVDVAGLKAWLTENPVTVYYRLQEPIITDLPLADQIALHGLETFDTVTYISTDSEVEPIIEVEYGTSKVGAYAIKGMNTAEANSLKIEQLNTLTNELATQLVAGSEV